MGSDIVETGKRLKKASPSLGKTLPKEMGAFKEMYGAIMKESVLDFKTKELIALSLGVAARCDGCIAHHLAASIEAGITREEIADALSVVVLMGGGPSSVYSALTLEAYDEMVG